MNLVQAWTTAEAARPAGWTVAGVFKPHHVADILEGSEDLAYDRLDDDLIDVEWWAVATGPTHNPFEWRGGGGSTPHQALVALAAKLRELRGDPNG